MFIFILTLLFGVVGLGFIIGGQHHRAKNKDRVRSEYNEYTGKRTEVPYPASPWYTLGGIGLVVLGAILFTISILTAVPAQNVGVVTSFGKPIGKPLDSGLHTKAPWHKVTDMDGTIQQENNYWDAPDPKDDNKKIDGRTKIRLNATNSEMFVNNQLRWRIKTAAAPRLFADWKTFDKIGPGLVQKQLSGALNEVLATYDPITVGAKNMTNDEIAAETVLKLQARLGGDVEVVGLTITTVDFDPGTQARINDFQAEVARTRQAEQRELTADADARANNKLRESLKDPNVLVSKCMDNLKAMVDKGQPLAGVPGCWPGQNGPVQTIPVK